MKTYLYLSTAIISVSLAAGGEAWAQCVSTQDCATLGYTESSCPNGGVKCPFGSKWACFPEPDKTADCIIGALYYSDGTCSQDKLSSKTLLGVVVYEKYGDENGWIMTVNPIQTKIVWGGYGTDIPGLTNITSESSLTDIQASCTNTDIITAYGSSSTYPAAWAAKNYKPTGTPSGNSWCLPSGGLLKYIDNLTNFTRINAGIIVAKGTNLGNVFDGAEIIWSSSEYNSEYVWNLNTDSDNSFNTHYTYKTYNLSTSVRPVMAF